MKPFYFIALLFNKFALIMNTIVPKTINIAYTIPTTLPIFSKPSGNIIVATPTI